VRGFLFRAGPQRAAPSCKEEEEDDEEEEEKEERGAPSCVLRRM
jgi:hypothetical protein